MDIKLANLCVIDLSNNNLSTIHGFQELHLLLYLNLSHNSLTRICKYYYIHYHNHYKPPYRQVKYLFSLFYCVHWSTNKLSVGIPTFPQKVDHNYLATQQIKSKS